MVEKKMVNGEPGKGCKSKGGTDYPQKKGEESAGKTGQSNQGRKQDDQGKRVCRRGVTGK